jgi:hypothetical protein
MNSTWIPYEPFAFTQRNKNCENNSKKSTVLYVHISTRTYKVAQIIVIVTIIHMKDNAQKFETTLSAQVQN